MIIVTKNISLHEPILVAAWPGMGDVALKAALVLKDNLKAVSFARWDAEGFSSPQGIVIENGIIEPAPSPGGEFYFWRNPQKGASDLIIFISLGQPALDQGHSYAGHIIRFAESQKVKKIISFAAMPAPIEYAESADVWVAGTDADIIKGCVSLHAKLIPEGHVSGLNGLILGVAKEHHIPGICLLGEIPLYAANIDNPPASYAVLQIFMKITGIVFSLESLKEEISSSGEEMRHLMEYFKNPFSGEEEPIGQEEIDAIKRKLEIVSGLPESVRKQIDELFKESRKNITKAAELKKELDHWNIYREYEDRFLDLFKKNPSELRG